MMWSAASVAGLLSVPRADSLRAASLPLAAEDVPNPSSALRPRHGAADALPESRGQVLRRWRSLLFLVQSVLGGKMAHDYADGASFFGFNLSQYLPFNIARTWHLQLAIFWIATAWLGMGIFIAPLVSGREPKGSARWSTSCSARWSWWWSGASPASTCRSRGCSGKTWWWLGTQGWEYLELGRLWMLS